MRGSKNTTCATVMMMGGARLVTLKLLVWFSLVVVLTKGEEVPDTETVSTAASAQSTPPFSLSTTAASNSTVGGGVTEETQPTANSTVPEGTTSNGTAHHNGTVIGGGHFKNFLRTSDAVLRAIYVSCGILTIIIIYVFIRIRRKNKKNKWHKYGILTSSEVEMTPLDQADEDEEATMFDARTFKKEYK